MMVMLLGEIGGGGVGAVGGTLQMRTCNRKLAFF
jgi:hypothetical protein